MAEGTDPKVSNGLLAQVTNKQMTFIREFSLAVIEKMEAFAPNETTRIIEEYPQITTSTAV